RCVSTSRIIIDKAIEPDFTKLYLEKVKRIKVGNGLNDDVFMGPLIEESGLEKWQHHNKRATEEGAEVLIDGQPLEGGEYSCGNFASP
ncbi:aldehyde dehydrogenase family protein, partial [Acinetobacter baumannii]